MNAPQHSLQRLAMLQRLAAEAEDTAARQLADALARHANAEDRRVELLQYELEYTGLPPAGEAGVGYARVAALTHQAGFVAKLREAVRFQAERVQLYSLEVDRARSRWINRHREVEKLEQLAAQVRQQLQLGEARRSAREHDELASSRWVGQLTAASL